MEAHTLSLYKKIQTNAVADESYGLRFTMLLLVHSRSANVFSMFFRYQWGYL